MHVRALTLHPSQQTTALHPSEGRRTEGGKGPASRWRSATQMFWLLLAAGGCITRWVPSDRTGRPSSCRLHAWINTVSARVAALYKNRLGHRRVLTAHPPGWGKGQRCRGSLAKSRRWDQYGVEANRDAKTSKAHRATRRSPLNDSRGKPKAHFNKCVFCFLEILK